MEKAINNASHHQTETVCRSAWLFHYDYSADKLSEIDTMQDYLDQVLTFYDVHCNLNTLQQLGQHMKELKAFISLYIQIILLLNIID